MAENADADDRRLLARHVRGDPDAFGLLVGRHRDRLWAVAVRTLGDADDAADALQEALLSAYRRAGTYRGEAAVTTWLHRIVVNACMDQVRRRSARPVVPLPVVERAEPARTGTDPAESSSLHLDLVAALRRLPFDQRVAVVLVDVQGYSIAEAATILDVPAGTVKSRSARGRARLAGELAGYGNRSRPFDVPASNPAEQADAEGGHAEGAAYREHGTSRPQQPSPPETPRGGCARG